MPINLIAACDLNLAIGHKNELLAKLPNDMAHFRKLTMGNMVVMGSKTYESIGKHLPRRTNIVLTRDENYEADSSCYVYHSVKDILHEYHNYGDGEAEVFIIGGSEVYSQFLDHADRIYLTIIHHKFELADAHFPRLSDSWKPITNVLNKADDKNPYDHLFIEYVRK